MRLISCAVAFSVAFSATVAPAASPRDTLIRAAFTTHDKAQALALIDAAYQQTQAILAKTPGDREARLQQALATGYRGQLKRSLPDAKAARDALFALGRDYPRDPEVQVALAGWHLTAVSNLGAFLARTVLGANRAVGIATLDRALALGGDRAFFPAYAALIRLRLDPKDAATPLALTERAATAATPTAIDRIMKTAAQRVAVPLRAGDPAAASALAKQLLPFGSFD